MAKVKSCVILNPPSTPEEQKIFDMTLTKTLAKDLYRSLGREGVDKLLEIHEKREEEAG